MGDANLFCLCDKACENRLYHDSCVEDAEGALGNRRRWKCKTCLAA